MVPLEEYVAGLDIAMHDAVIVRVGQSIGHIAQNPDHLANWEFSLLLESRSE